jgi:hypothetical protein
VIDNYDIRWCSEDRHAAAMPEDLQLVWASFWMLREGGAFGKSVDLASALREAGEWRALRCPAHAGTGAETAQQGGMLGVRGSCGVCTGYAFVRVLETGLRGLHGCWVGAPLPRRYAR